MKYGRLSLAEKRPAWIIEKLVRIGSNHFKGTLRRRARALMVHHFKIISERGLIFALIICIDYKNLYLLLSPILNKPTTAPQVKPKMNQTVFVHSEIQFYYL